MNKPRSFEGWVTQVPENLKQDPLWNFEVYPKTLFLYDLAWDDCQHLMEDRRGRAMVDQLTRSAGSICANIEEGYGRGYGKEYAYFLRVSIGSARESRGWYYRARRLLPGDVVKHRMALLDEIIAMLVPNIQNQKQYRRK
ncbi:MAG: four helix bundle protein [Anaerolineae bacterium]|nr:four helix bundle protein [Anaerolineae bacterium]